MKQILKIKSITDVITNSSSEVYVMPEEKALYFENLPNTYGCISINKIDWDWIKDNSYEYDLIGYVCGLDTSFFDKIKWEYMEDEWQKFIENNKDVIEKKIIKPNYYFVDIEDHFGFEDNGFGVSYLEIVTDDARSSSVYIDSRH